MPFLWANAMALTDDLKAEVDTIFRSAWSEREGQVIPEPTNLKLGNDGSTLHATVLYADMAESTGLVNSQPAQFAAEIYKSFLTCCARIIKSEGGVITAMAVYLGNSKNSSAAKTGLKINYAMNEIIRPALKTRYPQKTYVPAHCVGIDTSKLLVARVGVRNDNDLVWVGRAANYASKLCNLRDGTFTSWITGDVHKMLSNETKIGSTGANMWEERKWTTQGDFQVYRSSWQWSL